MLKIITKIIGTKNDRELKRIHPLVQRIIKAYEGRHKNRDSDS